MVSALERRGHPMFASTRRRRYAQSSARLSRFRKRQTVSGLLTGIDYAFLIAAATNYDRCEKDPLAKVINVQLIPHVVASLLEQGLFVTFISTNSVFGGERPWPNEDDPHAPGIAYARQKSESEGIIRNAAERLDASSRLNIVRLTKIMNASVSPVPAWLAAWKKNEPVQPFSDLVFAPISVKFVGNALATIGEKRISGNLHLSGAANVTYVEFANALARRLGVSSDLINPTTAVKKGVNIAFKPRFSGLGMTRTTELSGIEPQPLDGLVDDLIADLRD